MTDPAPDGGTHQAEGEERPAIHAENPTRSRDSSARGEKPHPGGPSDDLGDRPPDERREARKTGTAPPAAESRSRWVKRNGSSTRDMPKTEPIQGLRTSQDMNEITGDRAEWALSASGDGQAFGRVFDRHAPRLRRHAMGLVPTPADADDVVAVVFLEAWRRRDHVRFVDDSLLPWLLVTATNTAHNLTRSARRHRRFLSRFPVDDPAPDPADRYTDGDAVAAMRGLALPDQRVLTLCVIEGLSEREAAAVLGVAPGTVKSRLHRAKTRLHQRYTTTAEPLGGAL